MSNSYYLICVDCLDPVDVLLGKPVRIRYRERGRTNFGFSALGDIEPEGWSPDSKACESLQHFLMLHRGHELRVVPDTITEREPNIEVPNGLPVDDESTDPHFNRSAFFSLDEGVPDADHDARALPESLIERLRKTRKVDG